MPRHRVPTKRGFAYWGPFLFVIAAGFAAGMVALEHEALAWLMLLVAAVIGVPYLADAFGRFACGIGSPRAEARSLREANVELARERDDTVAELRLVLKSRDDEVRRRLIAEQHLTVARRQLADLQRPVPRFDATVLMAPVPADVTAVLAAVREPDVEQPTETIPAVKA